MDFFFAVSYGKYIQIFKAVEINKETCPTVCTVDAMRETASVKTHMMVKSCSEFEKLLHFSVAFKGLQHKLFFGVPFEQLLNPSIYPVSVTDWIRFMHKATTHAIGLLMTGPYADTLTAMSNYFKYTREGQSWADLWKVEGGKREREKRSWLNKRKEAQFTFSLRATGSRSQ